jgi:uracil-DNA glycosylase
MPTLFQLHVARYRNGCGAPECAHPGTRVCLARGQVPCDVLCVGEAPGESENALGRPFCGPAGHLLDHVVRQAGLPPEVRVAYTNLVGCIPRAEDGSKELEPSDEQVRACAGRLQDFVKIANPKLIVCVGRVAADYLDPGYRKAITFHRPIPQVRIVHPAAILRDNEANRWVRVRKVVLTLRSAVEDLLAGKLKAPAAPARKGPPPTDADIPF